MPIKKWMIDIKDTSVQRAGDDPDHWKLYEEKSGLKAAGFAYGSHISKAPIKTKTKSHSCR